MAKKPSFMRGEYTEKKDKLMDRHLMNKADFDEEQKKKFKKADTAHGKKKRPKTINEDLKKDRPIIKKIQAEEKRHEAKEGKKGEKAEEKREKKKKK